MVRSDATGGSTTPTSLDIPNAVNGDVRRSFSCASSASSSVSFCIGNKSSTTTRFSSVASHEGMPIRFIRVAVVEGKKGGEKEGQVGPAGFATPNGTAPHNAGSEAFTGFGVAVMGSEGEKDTVCHPTSSFFFFLDGDETRGGCDAVAAEGRLARRNGRGGRKEGEEKNRNGVDADGSGRETSTEEDGSESDNAIPFLFIFSSPSSFVAFVLSISSWDTKGVRVVSQASFSGREEKLFLSSFVGGPSLLPSCARP